MQAQADGIPPLFWIEPWRWAAPQWHIVYGAPPRDFDCRAARLIYSGWIEAFDLPRRWHPPGDPRWLHVAQASPAVLRGVASVLGCIALLRGGLPVEQSCRSPIDPWLAFALKFRDVNCMHSTGDATRLDLSASYACGVAALRAMARQDWPSVDSRLAMLVSPNTFDHAIHGDEPMQEMPLPTLGSEWIDVGRCLSLCGAVTRHAAAPLR